MLNLGTVLNPETFSFTNRLPSDTAQCYTRTSISAAFATEKLPTFKENREKFSVYFLQTLL